MQTVRLVLPELGGLGLEDVAAPMGGTGNRFLAQGSDQVSNASFEDRTIGHRAALFGDCGRKLSPSRPGGEIAVRVLGRDLGDGSFESHLSPERFPVEGERSVGVL